MSLTELLSQIGDEKITFQFLQGCLVGTQKATKQGAQITFIAPGIEIIDLVSAKSQKIGFVVWMPGDKFREVWNREKAKHEAKKEAEANP